MDLLKKPFSAKNAPIWSSTAWFSTTSKTPSGSYRMPKKCSNPLGILVDLDWKKLQMPFGPPFKIRFSEQDAMGLMKISGFTTTKQQEVGPYHYLITAKPSKQC